MNTDEQKPRPVQYFTKEYLEWCKTLTPIQILEFEEEFQKLMQFRSEFNRTQLQKKTDIR